MAQKTISHIFNSYANIGISNSMSFSLSLPLIINRSIENNLDVKETNIGDMSALFRYFSSPRLFAKPTNLQLSLGTTIPTGKGVTNVVTNEKNFVSDSYNPILNLIAAIMIKPGWSFDTRFYTRQILSYDDNRTKIGDLYAYGFNVSYAPVGSSYALNSQVKFINRGQDIFNDVLFNNSGGDYIYLTPGFSKVIFGEGETAIRMWSEVDIPLYQYVHGNQLTEKFNFRVGFNFGLNLFGHKEEVKPHSHDTEKSIFD